MSSVTAPFYLNIPFEEWGYARAAGMLCALTGGVGFLVSLHLLFPPPHLMALSSASKGRRSLNLPNPPPPHPCHPPASCLVSTRAARLPLPHLRPQVAPRRPSRSLTFVPPPSPASSRLDSPSQSVELGIQTRQDRRIRCKLRRPSLQRASLGRALRGEKRSAPKLARVVNGGSVSKSVRVREHTCFG